MALPAVAVPIAMGLASAGGAIFRASAAKKQAEAMMPKGFQAELDVLEARNRAGEMGLTEAQRGLLESDAAAQRAGLLSDQQARQMQQAQANAAFGGRELFLADVGAAEAQGNLMARQQRLIRQEDVRVEEENRQLLRELQQREADAEAARKMANRQLAADLFGVAASTAGSAYAAQQLSKSEQNLRKMMAEGNANNVRAAQMDIVSANQRLFGNIYGR